MAHRAKSKKRQAQKERPPQRKGRRKSASQSVKRLSKSVGFGDSDGDGANGVDFDVDGGCHEIADVGNGAVYDEAGDVYNAIGEIVLFMTRVVFLPCH